MSLRPLAPGEWRVVEIGPRPDGFGVFRDERNGRTVLEVGGVVFGWYTDRQILEGGELVLDWNAIDEGLRALGRRALHSSPRSDSDRSPSED